MAGVTLTVGFEDGEVRRTLGHWERLGRDPAPMLRAIGRGLVENTQDRFDAGQAPDGSAWEELRPWYAATKKGAGILREAGMRGGLQGSITFDVAGKELAVGSNKVYAAVHQFGATIKPARARFLVFRTADGEVFGRARSVTIPARPYLGISAADETMVLDVTEVFMMRAVRA